MSKPSIHVAIALIFHQGKVLVGWRNRDQHQGNKNEFPGGKIEEGEHPEVACQREVFEEVGINILNWHKFDVIQHDYDDLQVNLHFFHGYAVDQQLTQIQEPWTWYSREQLSHLNFPAANAEIVKRLIWPNMIKVSADLSDVLSLTENTVMYWRNEQPQFDLQSILKYSTQELNQLIINIEYWEKLDSEKQKQFFAVHFKQNQLLGLEKGQLPLGIRCIAACHDLISVEYAHQIGVDAVFLSPVQATQTHIDAQSLGWDKFKAIALHSAIPVFALGGLKPQDLTVAQQYHAYGIAGIRNF